MEELKERSLECLACGFQLTCDGDLIVRHFGLQLLEHFVGPLYYLSGLIFVFVGVEVIYIHRILEYAPCIKGNVTVYKVLRIEIA